MFDTKDISSRRFAEKIKDFLNESDDPHNIYTPLELCQEVVSKIPSIDGNILVIANLEFVYTLKRMDVPIENIYFATPCPLKAMAAKSLLAEHNVFMYNGVITKKDVGDMKFDVVVGNPPYSAGDVPGGKNTISTPTWYLFTEMAVELTQPDGFTAFVTPLTWIQKSNKMHNIITNNDIVHARVFSKSPFGYGVGTTASYWIVNKTPRTSPFVVYFDDIEIDTSGCKFLPTKADNITLRIGILNKTLNTDDNLDVVITDVHYANQKKDFVRATKDDRYKYPVYNTHTTSQMWSRIHDELHNSWKVILPYTGTVSRAIVDFNRSVTERAVAFPTNTEQQAINLLSAVQSKLFKFIIDSVRSNATISRPVFRSLPAVDLTRSWTDEELYEHFNLTEEEIKLIEDTIK